MHELSLCQAIAGVVRPYTQGRRVDVVRVQVGALRQVVPESLSFCWTIVREHENMPEAELELEFVTAEVRCRGCGMWAGSRHTGSDATGARQRRRVRG